MAIIGNLSQEERTPSPLDDDYFAWKWRNDLDPLDDDYVREEYRQDDWEVCEGWDLFTFFQN